VTSNVSARCPRRIRNFGLRLTVVGGPKLAAYGWKHDVASARRTSHVPAKECAPQKGRLPPAPLHGKFVMSNISDLIRNEGHVKTPVSVVKLTDIASKKNPLRPLVMALQSASQANIGALLYREPGCREVGRRKSPVAPGTHQSTFRIDSNVRFLLHIQRPAGILGISDDRRSFCW
jgi:hypothetical protein